LTTTKDERTIGGMIIYCGRCRGRIPEGTSNTCSKRAAAAHYSRWL
jgi:hypothetical protein